MNKMSKVRKYMVTEDFTCKQPTKSMFRIVEEQLPALKKDQFLVQAEYISVDPYMWTFASNLELPYMQFGFQVGKVLQSNNENFPVNSNVVSHSGWCDYAVLDGSPDNMFNMNPYIPDLGSLPRSLAIGALGMPGMAAYLGFMEICKPEKGDFVCVTGACGAVGSLVGQIAKIQKCKVIGFAGTDQKVSILKDDLKFDHAFNYKTEPNIEKAIKDVAPKGVNCFFDNVGGELSNKIMDCLSQKARVARCGAISTYGKGAATRQQRSASVVATRIEAFSFTQWGWSTQRNAVKQIREWIEQGTIIPKETITTGFNHLPDAFIGMLNGENVGKALVKV